MKRSLWSAVLVLVLAIVTSIAACGGSDTNQFTTFPDDDGGSTADVTTSAPNDAPSLFPSDGTAGGCTASTPLVIAPADSVVAVTVGQGAALPTTTFTATCAGGLVGAAWTIDRGEIGAIGVASGVFTPAGTLGGKATIAAAYQGHTASTSVTVKITSVGIGDPNPPDAGGGAGGFGGVGGSGEGSGATPVQVGILDGPPTADAALGFLYPYDKTVFPRGILPPLLQWTYGAHAFDAIRIHITEGAYEYKGYFQKPATPFQNHPLPQAVWDAIAYSNAGEDVNVELVFAVTSESKAYGPIKETWKVAQGTLKGTIYYNSYGTNLAHNLCCAFDGTTKFGGATLAIREGSTSPALVAGDDGNCRVCHSVASNGSVLVTQHGDNYSVTSAYALTNANAETTIPNNNSGGRFTYPALTPDGTMMFSNEGTSALYNIDGSNVAVTGLPALSAFTPAFSPDGKHLAFNFAGGSGSDKASIAAIDFDPLGKAFSNMQTLHTPPSPNHAYWPSFLPTNDAVVFQVETTYNTRDVAGTRSQCDKKGPIDCQNEGTHGEMWWVDLKTHTAARLDQLNGKGYVPPHPSYTGTAGDDSTLNYEPTVNPVPSGGYAWVVFTSRRLYGNVATVNPFWSDPRWQDLSATPTTKKLWVAAIDLNAKPGTDPSHPAFYLPAQELLAGNARGFWVVDPCHADGTSCQTGDECCGGYCRSPGDGGALVCTATQPSCSQEFEKCTVTTDCCGAAQGIQCINGRCATPIPR